MRESQFFTPLFKSETIISPEVVNIFKFRGTKLLFLFKSIVREFFSREIT